MSTIRGSVHSVWKIGFFHVENCLAYVLRVLLVGRLREDIHRLIHATNSTTINDILSNINLKNEQLKKLNNLRVKVGNNEIIF